jgi:hypothetical protein
MPKPAQVTAAEISRLAGVTRATVSNWRRRHADFPAPEGGTEASPAYNLDEVRGWLAARGQLPTNSAADDLRAALRAFAPDSTAPGRLLPLVLAAAQLDTAELDTLAELPDSQLRQRATELSRTYADDLPGVDDRTFQADEAGLVRALLRCVRREGPITAADVLAEHDGDDSGASGSYDTPAPLADLMTDLLTEPGESFPTVVFDPACGAGGLLVAAARSGARELYGQDIVPTEAAQAAVRLKVLAPTADSRVHTGDSMRADAFPTLTADGVLCAPPYGDREWGHEELGYDPRWVYGLPPKGEPELAWVQHCLAHLAPGAPAVLLMPPATAERAAGRRTRAELLRHGAVRAVVALPAGAAAPLHVGLHLWLLQRPQSPATTAQHVLFVETVTPEVRRTAAGSTTKRSALDWPALREIVLKSWHAYTANQDNFDTVPGTARAVPVVDLLDESVDLTPARHVRTTPASTQPDQYAETARALRIRLRRATAGLAALSGGETWTTAGGEPRAWRSATVNDLLRGGALTLLRAPAIGRNPTLGDGDQEAADMSGPRTLTVRDIAANRPPTGAVDETLSGGEVEIRQGDVILPELLHGGARAARVADARDAGHLLGRNLYLLRPDPERLDPWFLAGFLSAEENVNAAATGTSVVRLDARRLRVPLLPLPEQQRYGRAFRQLNAQRVAADIAGRLAEETARTLGAGLTGGALLPPVANPPAS